MSEELKNISPDPNQIGCNMVLYIETAALQGKGPEEFINAKMNVGEDIYRVIYVSPSEDKDGFLFYVDHIGDTDNEDEIEEPVAH